MHNSYAAGDFIDPIFSNLTDFSTGNFTLPKDIRTNNSVWGFQDNAKPVLLDSIVGNKSVDGHDYRSDFDWIIRQGFNWVITDVADLWATELELKGKRNMKKLLKDGAEWNDGKKNGWYKKHRRAAMASVAY
jgi:hypothetical protein